MTFEVFHGPARRNRTGRPVVTVQRNGVLRLNSSARRQLGEPAEVELLYDHDARVFGMRVGSSENAYRVTATGNVSAAAFVRWAKLEPRAYPATVVAGFLTAEVTGG